MRHLYLLTCKPGAMKWVLDVNAIYMAHGRWSVMWLFEMHILGMRLSNDMCFMDQPVSQTGSHMNEEPFGSQNRKRQISHQNQGGWKDMSWNTRQIRVYWDKLGWNKPGHLVGTDHMWVLSDSAPPGFRLRFSSGRKSGLSGEQEVTFHCSYKY